MTTKKPLVSIVIPTFNRVNLIGETLSSALSQSYENIEVIVLDNNSNDNTYEILKNKYEKIPSFKIYRNVVTLDIVRNWRKCFEYSKGEYVLILWSDDLIDPEFISKTQNFLEENPNATFVYSLTEIFNTEMGTSKDAFKLNKSGLIEKEVFIEKSLLEPPLSVPVSPANTLFRRKDVVKNLLINIPNNFKIDFSKIGQGNDNLLFLLALNDYSHFGYLDEKLSYFRDHSNSITLSTNSFLVTLRYHIAKAYFVSNSNLDRKLIVKFNSKVFLIMILCKVMGIKTKNSFNKLYSNNTINDYKLKYSIYFLIKYIKHSIKVKLSTNF